MAEILSSLPKSLDSDSAIGTMVDNSPEEEINGSTDKSSVNTLDEIQKISENSCIDDTKINCNNEEAASKSECYAIQIEKAADEVIDKDDEVPIFQDNQSLSEKTVCLNYSEDTNMDIPSNVREMTLKGDINIYNFGSSNIPIDQDNNVAFKSKAETCNMMSEDTNIIKSGKSSSRIFGMKDFEDDQTEELNNTEASSECPSYNASLQVNKQEVEKSVLNAEKVMNVVENIPLENNSKLIFNNEECPKNDSSLSNFLLSFDGDGTDMNELSGIEEVNKLSFINYSKLNSSSVVLSSSPSSLQVNPSIPEDLSEYSHCSDENISIIDSEMESTDETENEMVLSASMQFSLNKLANDSNNLAAGVDEAQASELSADTIPVEFKHKKQLISNEDGASEVDCISDIEEGPPKVEENCCKNLNICTTNHISEPLELPETVTKLTNETGSEVYLVGTAHFSKESQDDVSKTIQMVRPDIIVLELCKSRTAILELDEETILRESKSLDLSKIRVILNQHGKVQGVLYILLLSVSAHITEQLKMAPGGEFREAIHEASRTVPGCMIQLGDRPIQVTLSRALASLSVWQKAKLMWHIIASKGPISKEEVEKCKKKDFIEEMLAEMTGQFPGISEVFVKERDIFLTRSLQMAADPSYPNFTRINNLTDQSPRHRVVVGVVGIGHVSGIVELWNKVTEDDINAILVIPPPNLSDRIFKLTVKCTFYGLIGFGIYKCLRPTVKDSIRTFIGNSGTKLTDYFSKFFSR